MIVEMQCSVPMADYYAIGKTSVRWALGYYSTVRWALGVAIGNIRWALSCYGNIRWELGVAMATSGGHWVAMAFPPHSTDLILQSPSLTFS